MTYTCHDCGREGKRGFWVHTEPHRLLCTNTIACQKRQAKTRNPQQEGTTAVRRTAAALAILATLAALAGVSWYDPDTSTSAVSWYDPDSASN